MVRKTRTSTGVASLGYFKVLYIIPFGLFAQLIYISGTICIAALALCIAATKIICSLCALLLSSTLASWPHQFL